MDEDITEEDMLLFLLLRRHCRRQKRKTKHKKPKFWVRDIFRQIEQHGEYSRLVQELKTGDRSFFYRRVYILFILVANLTCSMCIILFCIMKISPESQTPHCKQRKNSLV